MKALIIYKSKTGFTKWYAEFIAKEVDGNLMDFKEVTAEIMSGFDACFMGMYEVAYQFRNCAKYMAFSPTSVIGGWNYEYIFSRFDSCLSGKNFAINAVDGYKETDYNLVNPDYIVICIKC